MTGEDTPSTRSARLGLRRAAGEFAVIVCGVLTALAGEAWVGAMREGAEIRTYRRLLAEDVTSDVASLEEVGAYLERVLHSGAVVEEWLRLERSGMRPDQLLVHVLNSKARHPVAPNRATWDDLSNTGKVSRLDREVRIALSEYYRAFESLWSDLGQLPTEYKELVDGVMPVDVGAQLDEVCIVHDVLDLELPPCDVDIEPWDPSVILSGFRATEGVHAALNRRMNAIRLSRLVLRELQKHAENVAAVLPRGGAV